MIHVPEHISRIKPYVPGKPIEELERDLGIKGSVKLASNENPLGPSPRAVKAIREGIPEINRYPDGNCHCLRNALSEKLGTGRDEIIFGNGSNEVIELAVRTFLRAGEEAVMAHPSFVVYSMIVQAAGGKNVIVPLHEERHDLKEMASRITDKTRMVFIANPNNPTGTINTEEEMDSFMQRLPDGVLTVIDEAYREYVTSPRYADTTKYLGQGKDVLILRTFSKAYALAGLRIGYGLAGIHLTAEMNKVRQPFNINALAQRAAAAAMNDGEHMKKTIDNNENGKAYLYRKLDSLALRYTPTEANFIYMECDDGAAPKIYEHLLEEGVIVRPMGTNALRITIGRPAENRKLAEALKRVMVKLREG